MSETVTRLAQVRAAIAAAPRAISARKADSVALIAVSKTKPAET